MHAITSFTQSRWLYTAALFIAVLLDKYFETCYTRFIEYISYDLKGEIV